jgi:hypothetical protein
MSFEEAKEQARGWLDEVKIRTGKYSQLLVEQLAAHNVNRTADVHCILDQIGFLEDPSTAGAGGAKEAKPFIGKLLNGFWHQHWFEARFIPVNLMNDAKSPEGIKTIEKISNAINRGDNPSRFVHELVIGGFERHYRDGKMTGEWIVFAKIENKNYYLTLGAHEEGENKILERIRTCTTEFPEITPLLSQV